MRAPVLALLVALTDAQIIGDPSIGQINIPPPESVNFGDYGDGGFGGGFGGQGFGNQFGNNFGQGQQVNPVNVGDFFEPRITDGISGAGLDGDFGPDFRITGYNLKQINWNARDRRAEEGWWHLYPFGERYYDSSMEDFRARPWQDKQIDLDFFFPYYGFRFNYTFIFPEGFIAFSYPWYIQPPYTFPTPSWPNEPDPSLVAAFMAPSSYMFVGDTPISNVWFRVVSRPNRLISARNQQFGQPIIEQQQFTGMRQVVHKTATGRAAFQTYGSEVLRLMDGRIQDPEMLDRISNDIHEGMVGARGFVADYALIVTWERMGYGGAPKSTQLDQYESFKRYQNTYQMVLATDEIRSYAILNYANVNWTSSTSSGAFTGRGGKQSAVVGFNGGNGTGFFEMPWSAEGNSYKLMQDGSTQTAGRWMARIDEVIEYGGCINTSTGILRTDRPQGTMLGGFALNVSGPCFRNNNVLKLQIFETNLDCERLDMVKGRCVVPVNSLYQTGMVNIKLSIDGGKEYNYWNKFYLISPNQARRQVNLIDDPIIPRNNWRNFDPDNLTLTWQALNLTWDWNSQVDITLWGYWEDIERHEFVEIGSIVRNIPNRGVYSFNPRTLTTNDMLHNAWTQFNFGAVQVRVSDNSGTWMGVHGDGIQWSTLIPFGFYFKDVWEYEYGSDWALEKCQDWFTYDGRLYNYWKDLEPYASCPCTLDQAMMDMGRFMPLYDCDMSGDSVCYYTKGSFHCVIQVYPVWTSATQTCCYDINGWLMFGQDYEYNEDWLRFYSAGVPYRAHPFGSYPYKRPPYVPALSNFYNDLMPYEFCCKWAGHCEFYYWRRETSGCQEYRVPSAGFAYGEPHFITYDGVKYTFNGKGYFVLSMLKTQHIDFMAQVRMEEPPKTIWNENVRATVITGVAARDNNSDVVQVFARKEFREWRYKMDVYVEGVRTFFDKPYQKIQHFKGVTVRSPARNMNMSEVQIMFSSGVGIRVQESRGILDVMIVLPPEYNETHAYWSDPRFDRWGREKFDWDWTSVDYDVAPPISGDKCSTYHRTMGLLGTFNGDPRDDLTTPDCNIINTNLNNQMTPGDSRTIFTQFGLRWRVDGSQHPLLFQEFHKPIYNPINFGENTEFFTPIFDPWSLPLGNRSLIFTRGQVRIFCQNIQSCEYDYLMTGRREIALDTLSIEKKNEGLKQLAERKLVSCGPLQKNRGVIKYPPGNNYLDGVTVTFSCKPEYFLHGDQQRICINGTWSPGWWAWCRERDLETGLKWMTGICVSILFIALVSGILCWCYCVGVRGRAANARHYRSSSRGPGSTTPHQMKPVPRYDTPPVSLHSGKGSGPGGNGNFMVPVMQGEPMKIGHARTPSGSVARLEGASNRYSETSH